MLDKATKSKRPRAQVEQLSDEEKNKRVKLLNKSAELAENLEKPEAQSSKRGSKRNSEIDDLFSSLREVKKAQELKQEQKGSEEVSTPFKKSKKETKQKKGKQQKEGTEGKAFAGNKDDIFGTGPSKVRRKTTEGYAIFSEAELGINKGGDTDLCPFDCDCCF